MNHVEAVLPRRAHANVGIGGEQEGADIERAELVRGNPPPVEPHQFPDAHRGRSPRAPRPSPSAEPSGSCAASFLPRPEEHRHPIVGEVRLHPFEDGLGVVEDCGRRGGGRFPRRERSPGASHAPSRHRALSMWSLYTRPNATLARSTWGSRDSAHPFDSDGRGGCGHRGRRTHRRRMLAPGNAHPRPPAFQAVPPRFFSRGGTRFRAPLGARCRPEGRRSKQSPRFFAVPEEKLANGQNAAPGCNAGRRPPVPPPGESRRGCVFAVPGLRPNEGVRFAALCAAMPV